MTKRRRLLSGVAAAALALTAAAVTVGDLGAALPKDRTISFTNTHTNETITIQYVKDGRRLPEATEKINWVMRDWRKNEPAAMDPELIDLLWELHAELGSSQPIHIICGYRSRGTNDMLRRTVGGQASESRHILGKAADVYFPDVPLKRLRYSALIRERGGVGYYPTSATPFIHVDTDRVRSWPRLPRFELALLFQNGRTQHLPADGGPIDTGDVQVAKSRYQDAAVQIAEYMGARRDPGRATSLLADAGAGAGRQPVQPRQVVAALPSTTSPAPAAALTPGPSPDMTAASRPGPAPNARTAPNPANLTITSLLPAEPGSVVDRASTLTPRPTANDSWQLGQLAAGAALVSFEPKLVAAPQPAARPRPATPALASLAGTSAPLPPSAPETAKPATKPEPRLAAIAPGTATALTGTGQTLTDAGFATGWVPAPAFDEEHPEELSYRPFPIAPYLTVTASADDPALVRLSHPDVAKTLELLDQAGAMPPMMLRPGRQTAAVMWAQQFQGPAVKPAADAAPATQAAAAIAGRKVKTSANE